LSSSNSEESGIERWRCKGNLHLDSKIVSVKQSIGEETVAGLKGKKQTPRGVLGRERQEGDDFHEPKKEYTKVYDLGRTTHTK